MKKTLLFLGSALAWLSAHAAEVPPCTLTVTAENFGTEWTSIDANNDGGDYIFKWDASNNGALYTQNKSGAANDWIISPAVTLKGGTTYEIVANVQNLSTFTSDKQDFTIYGGLEPTAAGMNEKAFSVTGLTKTSWPVDRNGNFTPSASGDYYIGLNLTSKSYNGDFLLKSFTITEVVAYPGAVTDLKVAAGAEGALEAILTWNWPTKNSLGGAAGNVTGAKIYRGTSSYFTANDASLVGTLEADGTPGTEGTYTDKTITDSGKYYYKVVPFDANGDSPSSPSSVQSPFIGMATSISNPTTVTAAAVEGNDKAITITWNEASASEGYVNQADVTYSVTRYINGASTGTELASGLKALSYTDDTLEELASYVYGVKATYNGKSPWSDAKSNAVVTGGTASLPYTNSFSSANDISLWTLFTGEGATRNWSVSSSKLNYWGSPADAWAATPAFELQAGKAYQITFTTYVSRAASPKTLSLYYGTEPTAIAMTENQIFEETISSTLSTPKTIIFSVAKDGIYNIAFRCSGPSDSNDIYVDDLTIKEIPATPTVVEELTATPAADGELKVTLEWTNPTLNTAGTALETIHSLVVKRGTEVLETMTDVAPGSKGTYTDTPDAPGKYTYSVIAYLNDNASDEATATTSWVGCDTPVAPAEVTAVLDADGNRTVTFSAVTEGVNGGYVDAANMRYIVTRNDVVLADNVAESPYVDSEADLPLAAYTYAVKATYGDYTGAATNAEQLIFGGAMELPYEPDMAQKSTFDLWTLTGGWKPSTNSSKPGIAQGSSSLESWAYTPPLHIYRGIITVTIKATCWSARYTENMDIYLTKEADNATAGILVAKDIDVSSVSYPSAQSYTVDIPEDGTYYVAFGQPTGANWDLYLQYVDVVQTVNTGIDEVMADDILNDPHARIYNLQGVEIQHPAPGQVVIVRSGDKAVKVKM